MAGAMHVPKGQATIVQSANASHLLRRRLRAEMAEQAQKAKSLAMLAASRTSFQMAVSSAARSKAAGSVRAAAVTPAPADQRNSEQPDQYQVAHVLVGYCWERLLQCTLNTFEYTGSQVFCHSWHAALPCHALVHSTAASKDLNKDMTCAFAAGSGSL